MPRTLVLLVATLTLLVIALLLNLSIGAKSIAMADVIAAIVEFDDQSYDHYIIQHQRWPRALIAMFVGCVMAVGGCLLQGVSRNPLASPDLLGISSGAVMFVVLFGFYAQIPHEWHGLLAFLGGGFGFVTCLALAKIAGVRNDPRNLALILAGAITSMLYMAIASALMLADMTLRNELLSWISGNFNHVYINRLERLWWLGLVPIVLLWLLSKPLTLIVIGHEKAASSGVPVKPVIFAAFVLVVISASTAVAICGPIGFIGLVVPHLVRPFAGAHFAKQIPLNALAGAALGLSADLMARIALAPYVLNTSVVMGFVGGIVFIVMVKKFYLSAKGAV